jgi:hypothetical protein
MTALAYVHLCIFVKQKFGGNRSLLFLLPVSFTRGVAPYATCRSQLFSETPRRGSELENLFLGGLHNFSPHLRYILHAYCVHIQYKISSKQFVCYIADKNGSLPGKHEFSKDAITHVQTATLNLRLWHFVL